jgi:hypothetical protein
MKQAPPRQGVLRMVRDIFHVCGFVEVGAKNVIRRIVLNGAAAWARRCANPLRALLKPEHVRVSLGETEVCYKPLYITKRSR